MHHNDRHIGGAITTVEINKVQMILHWLMPHAHILGHSVLIWNHIQYIINSIILYIFSDNRKLNSIYDHAQDLEYSFLEKGKMFWKKEDYSAFWWNFKASSL